MSKLKIDKRRKLKKVEINNNFIYFKDALLSAGFTILENEIVIGKGKEKIKDLYKKDGKTYEFIEADHFNNYIYSLTLREMGEI